MPTVPTITRQVGPAPLSGARLDPTAPSAAFQPPATVDLGGVAHVSAQLAARDAAQMDQIAVNTAAVQAHEAKMRRLYDPTEGALNKKGLDALRASHEAEQGWTQDVGEIAGSLQNDRQRLLFSERATSMGFDVADTLTRHAHQELLAHDTRQTDALLDIAKADAVANVSDPAKVEHAVAVTKAHVADYGRRNGWSPEQLALATAEKVSEVHLSVLKQLLAAPEAQGGGDLRASAYLTAHRAELHGADLVKAEKLTDAGSVLGESQRQADTILRTTPDLAGGLTAAAKIADPRVRDATEHRVRQGFLDRAADARQAQMQAFHDASSIVEKTGSFDAIPLSLRVAMSPEENGALQHRVDQIRHPKEFGDPETYFHLLNLASVSPQSRQQFLAEDILSYKGLSSSERQRLIGLQRSISLTAEGRAYSEQLHITVRARHDAEDLARLHDGLARAAKITDATERAAEEARVRQHYTDVQSYRHATATAPGDATPPAVGFSAKKPLEGLLTPAPVAIRPTPKMLEDAAKSPAYAKYLRSMQVDLPAVLPTPAPEGQKKK